MLQFCYMIRFRIFLICSCKFATHLCNDVTMPFPMPSKANIKRIQSVWVPAGGGSRACLLCRITFPFASSSAHFFATSSSFTGISWHLYIIRLERNSNYIKLLRAYIIRERKDLPQFVLKRKAINLQKEVCLPQPSLPIQPG